MRSNHGIRVAVVSLAAAACFLPAGCGQGDGPVAVSDEVIAEIRRQREKDHPRTDADIPAGEIGMYFWSREDRELVVMSSALIPPVEKDGKKFFKAYVFSCGSCDDESQRFVGYYEGFGDDTRRKLDEMRAKMATDPAAVSPEEFYLLASGPEGRLISSDGVNWVDSMDSKGIEILTALSSACAKRGGGQLRPCYPGQK